jgi:hypothetical protein
VRRGYRRRPRGKALPAVETVAGRLARVDPLLIPAVSLIRKDFKQQGWISPEIGGLVLTSCSDSASCNGFPGLFCL